MTASASQLGRALTNLLANAVHAGGAGLGLAIARGIVAAHDGQVTITSHGDGCLGLVRLPLTSSQPS